MKIEISRPFCLLISVILFSCHSKKSEEKGPKEIDTVKNSTPAFVINQPKVEDEPKASKLDELYADYFIVVEDTGSNYFTLKKQLFEISSALNLPIDTMGRTYDPVKKLIALPEDDKDEIYAGEYYGRRSPDESLSLEYLNFYQKKADQKTIALVTGIYASKKSADSALSILKKIKPQAFLLKSNLYIGCMH